MWAIEEGGSKGTESEERRWRRSPSAVDLRVIGGKGGRVAMRKRRVDIEWIVHRAGIYGDGPSKGRLERSNTNYSVANHRDCADYSYRLIMDTSAIHTSDFSHYTKS